MRSRNKRTWMLLLAAGVVVGTGSSLVSSHCEIPCGIYNDPMRLDMMAEDITTVEKAMKEIQTLSAAGEKNYNQIVRWVANKDEHADRLSDVVAQYFLTQRIKPVSDSDAKGYSDYVRKLALLHQMMIASMKCKQTTDLQHVATLRSLLAEFRTAYLGETAAQAR